MSHVFAVSIPLKSGHIVTSQIVSLFQIMIATLVSIPLKSGHIVTPLGHIYIP